MTIETEETGPRNNCKEKLQVAFSILAISASFKNQHFKNFRSFTLKEVLQKKLLLKSAYFKNT